jgi:serine/threonine protein phosphatase PrpC
LWAGDSRLYRLRGSNLDQITRDHNPISDLLDSGAVSESEALSTDTNVITRAVGGQSRLVLDIAVFDILPDDTFLLCSDGLYREIDPGQICQELGNADVRAAVTGLMAGSLKGEARDNISMVVTRPSAD